VFRINSHQTLADTKQTIVKHLVDVVPPGTFFIDAWGERVIIFGEPAVKISLSRTALISQVIARWDVIHSDGKAWPCFVDYRIRRKNIGRIDLLQLILNINDPAHFLPHQKATIYFDELPGKYRRKPTISIPKKD